MLIFLLKIKKSTKINWKRIHQSAIKENLMGNRKIVVALGGNAILSSDPSAKAQQEALVETAKHLVKLIKNGLGSLSSPEHSPTNQELPILFPDLATKTADHHNSSKKYT